ncbi:hypothetical protein RHECNPAF_1760069 [Rhizobium etli CNPAF512]|nr:hypothetical protein RHECNPAF_1760069 [Rhizobium etli CNPAF512]
MRCRLVSARSFSAILSICRCTDSRRLSFWERLFSIISASSPDIDRTEGLAELADQRRDRDIKQEEPAHQQIGCGNEIDRDLRRQLVDEADRDVEDHAVDQKGARQPQHDIGGLLQRVGKGDQRRAHLRHPAEGHGRVGIDQRAEDDVMEIHDEQNHDASKGDEAGKAGLRRVFDDVGRARLGITDHHGDDRRGELHAERIDSGEHAVHQADKRFAENQADISSGSRVDSRIDRVPEQRHECDRQRTGDEDAQLLGHARRGKTRKSQHAAANPAEDQKQRENGPLRVCYHEIEPKIFISMPLASSTCDRTGSVANSRSMIMRT